MEKLFLAIFGALFQLARNMVVVGLAVGFGMLLASFLCNIDVQETYSWISGIWHGLFVIPNFFRNLLNPDILYKGIKFSAMYNVFWWTFVIIQIPTYLVFLSKLVIEPISVAISLINE